MKAVWLAGWAIGHEPMSDLANTLFPAVDHRVILPVPGWEGELEMALGEGGRLIAYSTGTLLLMSQPELGRRASEVTMLAPILDFKSDNALGGRVREAQLEYLKCWLLRDPLEAVRDFYRRAGLSFELPTEVPVGVEDLVWGVDQLLALHVNPAEVPGWRGWIGEADRLLDAAMICQYLPRCRSLPGVGHDLRALVEGAEMEL